MSVGGWKCKKVVCEYKSTKMESSKSILRASAEAIINLGTGWQLDESRNPTLDDFVQIGSYNDTSENYQPALFLVHNDGAKLMLKFSIYRQSMNQNMFPKHSSNSTFYQLGLCGAMIPKQHSAMDWDSTSNYTTISAIPSKATRLLGTDNSNQPYVQTSFYRSTPMNILFIGKDDTLTVLAVQTNVSARPRTGFSLGSELIPTLACEGDSDTTGVILYYNALNMDNDTPFAGILENSQNRLASGFNSVGADESFRCGLGSSVLSCAVTAHSNIVLKEVTEYSISGRLRFVAVAAVMWSSNLLEYNVVKGDGFKGYYSTDFMRYVGWESALPIGQLIDGGNFIHLGAGIIHGWDPSITESIF